MDIKKITESFLSMASSKTLYDWVSQLMNRIEELTDQLTSSNKKIDQLEAQIRKLQGLPSKPKFNTTDKTSDLDKEDDDDDDDDKQNPKAKTKKKRKGAAKKTRRKKKELEIDKVKKVAVNPEDLDSTFDYKGTRRVVVQDIIFKRNNIAFDLEKFYSKKHGMTVEADLPAGYDGGYFGPNVIAFIKASYYEGDVTIKKMKKILTSIGIFISARQINRIINDTPDELVQEMDQAREAAIEKTGLQQIDDTVTKLLEEVDGSRSKTSFLYTTVTCNSFFSLLRTSRSKNRQEAIKALCGGTPPLYKINLHAILVCFSSLKSMKVQSLLEKYQGDKVYTQREVDELLKGEDFLKLKPPTIRDIKTAMMAGAFYDGHLGNVGSALVSDDAGQFNLLYDDHVLCWPHELRHYKDLDPIFEEHQKELATFFVEAKMLYKALKVWIVNRKDKLRDEILKQFTELFERKCRYKKLADRKKLSLKKMDKLLAPLFTEIKLPLDNNESERDLRGRKIKQKISLFDRTMQGVKARDLYISLKQTCRKNGVSFYQFLLSRQMQTTEVARLREIIMRA